MGKLSNAQRGLKKFLIHRLGRRITDDKSIDRCISVYVDWYNNGKKVFLLQNAAKEICSFCESSFQTQTYHST
jgi:hypothetical protein